MATERARSETFSQTAWERGIVKKCRLQSDWKQSYFLYIPKQGASNAKIFVTVHGISRNAKQHAREFSVFAEKYGVVLIAPFFPEDEFPDYQRLGRKGKRADIALNAIVAEVAQLTGADASKFYLFGYSGGAQFAHRYMMAYPHRIAKVVLGAAGWYTFPDRLLKFPQGTMASHNLPLIRFNPEQFLQIPVCVLIGERDNHRDRELNQSSRIDRLQGSTRIERGKRWIEAMSAQAHAFGLPANYSLQLLPDSPHSFSISMRRGEMGERTFDFLFADDVAIPSGMLRQLTFSSALTINRA
ncbi:MAG: hypothetical protein KF839_00820 [Nitrosomonas sp.]|nr:hypothetical protein [Nitrosomonas sp.]